MFRVFISYTYGCRFNPRSVNANILKKVKKEENSKGRLLLITKTVVTKWLECLPPVHKMWVQPSAGSDQRLQHCKITGSPLEIYRFSIKNTGFSSNLGRISFKNTVFLLKLQAFLRKYRLPLKNTGFSSSKDFPLKVQSFLQKYSDI